MQALSRYMLRLVQLQRTNFRSEDKRQPFVDPRARAAQSRGSQATKPFLETMGFLALMTT